MDLSNCPKCGEIFVKNAVREMCEKCFREEEKLFQKVYTFLKKRENRAATIETVVKANNVEAELLYKWIKKGKLHTTLFPNMGYPCDNCGTIITKGKLCDKCSNTITSELAIFEEEKERMEKLHRSTYHSQK